MKANELSDAGGPTADKVLADASVSGIAGGHGCIQPLHDACMTRQEVHRPEILF
jgi:hypothetical protein